MPWGINQPRIAPIYQDAYDQGAKDFNSGPERKPEETNPHPSDPEKDDWNYDYDMGFFDAEGSYYS